MCSSDLTTYPRSAGFDTDIGAFIESSSVSSLEGLMAPSNIINNTVQGEAFLPGQIFVFGGFALWSNSLGHLEQIESYAPGHQVRFGSLNYMADIRGDLIFDGFEPLPCASCWKYALEAIIKVLLLYFLVHDNCLLFMLCIIRKS